MASPHWSSRWTTAARCMTGVSSHLLSRLQSIMNVAARLIFYARRSNHITPLLHDIHWLSVPERIQFRLCVLTFRCLHNSAPSYLANSPLFVAPSMSLVVNVCAHPMWPRSSSHPRAGQRSATVPFQWPHQGPGTVCLRQSGPRRPYRRFVVNWNPLYSYYGHHH